MQSPLKPKAAILQALIQGRGYGLEIIDRLRENSDGQFRFLEGSIYPALRSLEREGLVRSFKGEPLKERGGRPRVYYELTAEGSQIALEQQRGLAALVLRTVPT